MTGSTFGNAGTLAAFGFLTAYYLIILSRRRAHLFSRIENDLEASMQASARSHDEDMGKVIPVERPLAPTFEELELALQRVG